MHLRLCPAIVLAVVLVGGNWSTALAQLQLNHPEQFYSNGEKVNAWTTNPDAKVMSTFWFVKNPKDSLVYQQMIAIVYDNQPGLVYYYGVTEKKFVGRFEIENQKYSMLKPQDRRQKLADIPPGAFPPADEMPSVGDMLPPPTEGEANDDEMMMPPPTMQFPQLEDSVWESAYATPQGRRVRAKIIFNGNEGVYQLQNSDSEGELSDVVYQMQASQNRFEIRGRWTLGGASGFFKFRVPMDDLFRFTGFSSQNPNANDGGIWDAVRVK
jgi:hypothetical protein